MRLLSSKFPKNLQLVGTSYDLTPSTAATRSNAENNGTSFAFPIRIASESNGDPMLRSGDLGELISATKCVQIAVSKPDDRPDRNYVVEAAVVIDPMRLAITPSPTVSKIDWTKLSRQ
jgi:hypothetical protein